MKFPGRWRGSPAKDNPEASELRDQAELERARLERDTAEAAAMVETMLDWAREGVAKIVRLCESLEVDVDELAERLEEPDLVLVFLALREFGASNMSSAGLGWAMRAWERS